MSNRIHPIGQESPSSSRKELKWADDAGSGAGSTSLNRVSLSRVSETAPLNAVLQVREMTSHPLSSDGCTERVSCHHGETMQGSQKSIGDMEHGPMVSAPGQNYIDPDGALYFWWWAVTCGASFLVGLLEPYFFAFTTIPGLA